MINKLFLLTNKSDLKVTGTKNKGRKRKIVNIDGNRGENDMEPEKFSHAIKNDMRDYNKNKIGLEKEKIRGLVNNFHYYMFKYLVYYYFLNHLYSALIPFLSQIYFIRR